jgi:hypothetical protein
VCKVGVASFRRASFISAGSTCQKFHGCSAATIISTTASFRECSFLENEAGAGDEAILKVGFSAQVRAQGCSFVNNDGFAVETDAFNSYFFPDLRTEELNAPAKGIKSLLPLRSGGTDDADFPFLQQDDPLWLQIQPSSLMLNFVSRT